MSTDARRGAVGFHPVSDTATLILVGLAVIALWLMTKRWFWVLSFALATLASAFTVIASVIHFQILGAVGFTILTVVLGLITAAIAATGDP